MNPVEMNTRGLISSVAMAIIGLLVSFLSVAFTKVTTMGTDPFFIFQVAPLSYWLGIVIIVLALLFMIPHLGEKRFRVAFVFSSILLVTGFRMVFPIIFNTVAAYEADAVHYITVISSWVTTGVDFGVEGSYQHNYPMSYLVAFACIKLGLPLDTFYRNAPFVFYALVIIILYLIIEEVVPESKKKSSLPALSVFLFSFSSLGYWVTVHYCPELFGSLMFLISLYLGIRFAKNENWNISSTILTFASIFILILSHHLSTVYMIFTFFGLSLSCWFFKSPVFKKGALAFLILGIFTYTAWFGYGQVVYPTFFNIYSYFSGFSNVAQQSSSAGLVTNLTFAVYPAFIFVLFGISFFRTLQIQQPKLLFSLQFIATVKEKLREVRLREASNITFVFSMGFILLIFLFIIGLGLPVLFGTRILEVLCIGAFPLASQALMKLFEGKSRRTKYLVYVILLLVILTCVYRYYNQIQRRMTV